MSSLAEAWRSALQSEAAAHPTCRAYVLIDAAQLPGNVMPWKEYVQEGRVANLCVGYPEADHPEVCALLIDHETVWLDALMDRYLPRRPFAFTALHSALPMERLSGALNRRTKSRMQKGLQGFVRYFDAATLPAWLAVMTPSQRKCFLSVAHAWQYVDRVGQVAVVKAEKTTDTSYFLPSFDEAQLKALSRHGLPDRVASDLRKNRHIIFDFDPFDLYRALNGIATTLERHGVLTESLAYRVSVLWLSSHANNDDIARLELVVSQHAHDPDVLCEHILEMTESA